MMSANGIDRIALIAALGVISLLFSAAAQDPPPPPPTTPITQVQIQIWISEFTENGLRSLGANLNYVRFVRGKEQTGSVQQVVTQVFDEGDERFTVTLPEPDQTLFDDTLRGDTEAQGGAGLEFDIIDVGRGTIDGVFRGIEQNTDFDLISKPELLVRDKTKAEIHAGSQVPYQDVQYNNKGEPVLNVDWKDVGVNLEITPEVRPDNLIKLDIGKLDVIDASISRNIRGVDLPVFSQRSQNGTVLVPNGQTLVIGGLSTRSVFRNEQRVPLVGSIPLLGIPFRGRDTEAVNSNLVIFVSPTVVDLRDLKPRAMRALNFWREEGWRNRDRIDREIVALEQEL